MLIRSVLILLMTFCCTSSLAAQSASLKRKIEKGIADAVKETLKFPSSYRAGKTLYMELTMGWYNSHDTARINEDIRSSARIMRLKERMMQNNEEGTKSFEDLRLERDCYARIIDSLTTIRDKLAGDEVIGWRVLHQYQAHNSFGHYVDGELIVQTDLHGTLIGVESP